MLFRKYQVEMKKIQDQESKLNKFAEDDERKQEQLKKRKEQWEEKLRKKKEEVTLHLSD